MGTSSAAGPVAAVPRPGPAGPGGGPVAEPSSSQPLLRFLACGSVDDGKSTLIGRLLHDTRAIHEDHLAAVARDSTRFGTTGEGEIDLALVTDGLGAEREQNITIDVAYRQFRTARRRFMVADTPGHEQYTRNMVTGASTSEAAVILVDARHGVRTQTRRHSYVVALLGIRHVIVAVNKMDLVLYSRSVFNQVRTDYLGFTAALGIPDVRFVPLCALTGANVVEPSDAMPWYTGPTLLGLLETLSTGDDRGSADLRLPVQYVIRPNADFRGLAGTVATGRLEKCDEVMVLPSGLRARVGSIIAPDGEVQEAGPLAPVVVTLEDAIDVARGDMLVSPTRPPQVSTRLEADVVWMAEAPLVLGRGYWIKHTTRTTLGRFADIRYRTDVDTLAQCPVGALGLNEIGRVALELSQPVACDPYAVNRVTGAFIVIDRITNHTVGAGMIHAAESRPSAGEGTSTTADTRSAPSSSVSPSEREARLGQRGVTVLLYGPRATELAFHLERRLFDSGRIVTVLDRNAGGLADVLGISQDSSRRVRRVTQGARLLSEAGLICICPIDATDEVTIDRVRAVRAHFDLAVQLESFRDELMSSSDSLESCRPDLTLSGDARFLERNLEHILHMLQERGVLRTSH